MGNFYQEKNPFWLQTVHKSYVGNSMYYHKMNRAMKPGQDIEGQQHPEVPLGPSSKHDPSLLPESEPRQNSTLAFPGFELYINGIILYAFLGVWLLLLTISSRDSFLLSDVAMGWPLSWMPSIPLSKYTVIYLSNLLLIAIWVLSALR